MRRTVELQTLDRRSKPSASGAGHSHAHRSYWLAALLFRVSFVLLILIMSWLFRTIWPVEPSMTVAIVEAPLPPSVAPPLDPTPTLKASLSMPTQRQNG